MLSLAAPSPWAATVQGTELEILGFGDSSAVRDEGHAVIDHTCIVRVVLLVLPALEHEKIL